MPSVPELTWMAMTATVNEIKPSSDFLWNLLFPNSQTHDTEHLEYSVISGDRAMAPFIQKNGRSIMVGGVDETFYNISPPNIRISRPMEASEKFFKRRPGTVVFPTSDAMATARQQAIARDLEYMSTLIDNRIEWLVAMALRGAISWESEGDAWTITFPRSSSHSYALSGTDVWTDAASKPHEDFLDAKSLINDATGLNPTDVIMSRTAYDAFRNNANVKDKLDNRRMAYGQIGTSPVRNGAIYGGVFEDVRVWCYTRSLKEVTGSSTALIRDKYVEFVTADPAAMNELHYAAIADWDAYQGGAIRTERFSKSWTEKDPSALMSLIHTRPLPVPKRPDSTVSIQVLA